MIIANYVITRPLLLFNVFIAWVGFGPSPRVTIKVILGNMLYLGLQS